MKSSIKGPVAAGLLALVFAQSAHAHTFNMNTAPQPTRDWTHAATCLKHLPVPDTTSIVRDAAQPFNGPRGPALVSEDPYEIIFALREKTPENAEARSALITRLATDMAAGAVAFAFGGNGGDATTRRTGQKLRTMLARLPEASASERATIHKDAYDLRLALDRQNYATHYVAAAHSVAMAASHSTSLSLHGNGRKLEGDAEWIALYATADSMENAFVSDLSRVLKRDLRRPTIEIDAAAAQQGLIQFCDKNYWGDSSTLYEMGTQDALRRTRDIIHKSVMGFTPR